MNPQTKPQARRKRRAFFVPGFRQRRVPQASYAQAKERKEGKEKTIPGFISKPNISTACAYARMRGAAKSAVPSLPFKAGFRRNSARKEVRHETSHDTRSYCRCCGKRRAYDGRWPRHRAHCRSLQWRSGTCGTRETRGTMVS